MAELVQCLQNQMNLLAVDTQADFEVLAQAASAQIVPLETLQSSIQRLEDIHNVYTFRFPITKP